MTYRKWFAKALQWQCALSRISIHPTTCFACKAGAAMVKEVEATHLEVFGHL